MTNLIARKTKKNLRTISSLSGTVRSIVALLAVVTVCSMIFMFGSVQGQVEREKLVRSPKRIPGHYIVVLEDQATGKRGRNSAAPAVAAYLASVHKGRIKHVYQHAINGFSVEMTEAEAIALSKDPRVEYVEEDSVVTVSTTQANPPSWGLDRIDQRDSQLDQSYTYNLTGAGVKAYIIDSGIYTDHSDFGGRASSGYGSSGDCYGHGTHVAGTLGGNKYGVAKGVTLISVRVFDCNGNGTDSGVIAGVDWVTSDHQPGEPAVANMSLITSEGRSPALDFAVRRSMTDGVTYVVAAGNDNENACEISPAAVSEAITVGAVDRFDRRANFSNYGTCVDIFAPGVGITSALNDGGYGAESGTSTASPHVAGVAALYLESHPEASPSDVARAITGAATDGRITDAGEGSPNLLLFSQFFENSAPSISAVSVTHSAGTVAVVSNVATVGDAEDYPGSLAVTVNGSSSAAVNGVTISNLVANSSGNLTAKVSTNCNASNASFTLRVTDTLGLSAETTLNVTVTGNPPPTLGNYPNATVVLGGGTSVTPSSPPSDTGSVEDVKVTAPGFTGTATVNPATGVVSISNAGPLGGFTVAVTVTDSCGLQVTKTFTLTVVCPAITLGTLPNGVAGTNYNKTISVAPAGAYTFSLAQGSLPPGLTLNASTGNLGGLPSAGGQYSFTIRAVGKGNCVGTQSYSLTITCPSITLSALPTPVLYSYYNQTVTASPSGGNYSFAVTAGTLPAGLSLNSATGLISGAPTVTGPYNFTINATRIGTTCSGSRAYSGTISGFICAGVSLPNIPNGTVGQLYNQSVVATPGSGSGYTYSLSGTLPPGVSFNPQAALLYGSPTAAGTYNFIVTAVRSSDTCRIGKSYSLTIR